jgi:BTB/POZ domain
MCYDDEGKVGKASLEEVKKEILEKCQVPAEIQARNNSLKTLNQDEFLERIMKLESEVEDLTGKVEDLTGKNEFLVEKVASFLSDSTKDFTITVKDQQFKVHKFLLIARSQVLAEMIENNPGASNLELKFIPLDTLQHLLDFLYDDTYPAEGFNDIFIASGYLKIENLKNYAGLKLIDQVNAQNAFEMLKLANKYDHDGLRSKAFEFVKGMFPDRDLKDEMARNQECIEELYFFIKSKMAMEKALNDKINKMVL